MKRTLLLLCLLLYSTSHWSQIREYQDDNGNRISFQTGQSPDFVEWNSKLYFVANNNSTNNTAYIWSIDQNDKLKLEFGSNSSDAISIRDLVVYNNQLYFASANKSTAPNTYRLYLFDDSSTVASAPVSSEVSIDYSKFGKLFVWNNRLLFNGRLQDGNANANGPINLCSYSTINGFQNISTRSSDFVATRFTAGNNLLYFFENAGQNPANNQPLYVFSQLREGNNNLILESPLNNFYFEGNRAPAMAFHASNFFIIGRPSNGTEERFYKYNGGTNLTQLNTNGLVSSTWIDATNRGKPVVAYKGGMAILQVSADNSANDRIVLHDGDKRLNSFDLGAIKVRSILGVLNDAVIFTGAENNNAKLYELRLGSQQILPEIRPVDPTANFDNNPLFAGVFNQQLYYYGKPQRDSNIRSLHQYDSKILHYSPLLENQSQVDAFGNLGFKRVLQQLTVQDDFANNGGLPITNIQAFSSLEFVDYLLINNTQLQNLAGLENVETVDRFLEIFQNGELTSLQGLNPNITFNNIQTPSINNNAKLNDFCALQPWAASNTNYASTWSVTQNAYNPSFDQLRDPNSCNLTVCTPLTVSADFETYLENPQNRFVDSNGNTIPNTDIANGNNNGSVCLEGVQRIARLEINSYVSMDFLNIGQFRDLRLFRFEPPMATNPPTTTGLDLSNNHNLEEVYLSPSRYEYLRFPTATDSKLRTVSFGSLRNYTFPNTNYVVDLSNKPNLESVSGSTIRLDNLNLSNNPKLKTIFFLGSSLGKLSINNSPQLESIDIRGTKGLQNLSLEDMPNLQTVQLSGSQLQNLTIRNTGLSQLRLEDLLALENVILEFADGIQNVNFGNTLSKPTSLRSFKIQNSQVTTLDLSGLVNLVSLDVSYNTNLQQINGFEQLTQLEFVKTYDTNITSLDFANNDGSLSDLQLGTGAYLSDLEFLNLKNNNLVYNNIVLLAEVVNPANFCLQVTNVARAQAAVNNGNWQVNANANFFKVDCNCTTLEVDPTFESILESGMDQIIDIDGYPILAGDLSDGIPNNGLICLEAAQRVASIVVSDMSNINFKNIGQLINLKSLDVDVIKSGTIFSNLDLSQNDKLETLILDGGTYENFVLPNASNSSLKTISLDTNSFTGIAATNPLRIAGYTELTTFGAEMINHNDLQISNCRQLNTATILGSVLDTFTISNQLQLDRLEIYGGNINSFILENINNLQNIVFKAPIISNISMQNVITSQISFNSIENLQSLELKDMVALSGLNLNGLTSLQNFLLTDSPITSINFSGLRNMQSLLLSSNEGLGSLIGFTDMTQLEDIRLEQTGLQSLDLSTNSGSLNNLVLGSVPFFSNMTFVNLKNNNLNYDNINLKAQMRNPDAVCIQVNTVASANTAVANGNWEVNANANFFKVDCGAVCTSLNISDPNLRAFFLDSSNASKILDSNGNPISDLADNGEICREKAALVYQINLTGGYNNKAISSLAGMESFSNLQELYANDAQIEGIVNLGIFPNLKIFEAQNNAISSLQVGVNSQLEAIQIAGQGFNSDVLYEITFQNSLPSLTTLGASQNRNLLDLDFRVLPNLSFLRLDETGVKIIDLSFVNNLDNLDTSYFKDEQSDGALEIIDLRNNLGNFNIGNFLLDAQGHPNLRCVLVNAGDLAVAQSNLSNGNWKFDQADVVRTFCPVDTSPSISFVNADESGLENNINFGPSLRVVGTVNTTQTINLVLSNTSTATFGSDFTSSNNNSTIPIQIPAGTYDANSSWDIQLLDLVEDINYEGNEQIIYDLDVGASNFNITGKNRYTYTILEDDYRIEIFSSATVNEGEDAIVFELQLRNDNNQVVNNQSGAPIPVQWNHTGKAINGTDYSIVENAVFGINTNTTSIRIKAEEDNLFEREESIIIEAISTDYYKVNSATIGTSSIADNDHFINIDNTQEGVEGQQNPSFRIFLSDSNGNMASNATGVELEFELVLRELNATDAALIGIDFEDGINGTVGLKRIGIPDGNVSNSFYVGLIDDQIDEQTERFAVDLEVVPNQVLKRNDSSEAIIIDNDSDIDNDGILDAADNCPNTYNPAQEDLDNDGKGDACDTDIDGDGVLNDVDDCPREIGTSDNKGCPQNTSGIDAKDITIFTLSETCAGQNNGSIQITTTNTQFNFEILLNGTSSGNLSLNQPVTIENLGAGSYEICIKQSNSPNFNPCYGIQLKAFENIEVQAGVIDLQAQKAQYIVAGSTVYTVMRNGLALEYHTQSTAATSIDVPLEIGYNHIHILGQSDCQGSYQDAIELNSMYYYPNPVRSTLYLEGALFDRDCFIEIFTIQGTLMQSGQYQSKNDQIEIGLDHLPNGFYVLYGSNANRKFKLKIIKN
ncbi:MAG: thrombospondin type 3 repeat-containing protein [Flavobacteriaceae bacterium]|nr:thrombospondin type 3 repeat-containing protein [Flavobacteriaceae bacterium]